MIPKSLSHETRATLAVLGVIVRELARALYHRLRRLLSGLRGTPTLRVGVDIRPFYEPLTGVGWYLHFLLAELSRRPDLEIILFGDARTTDQGPFLHVTIPQGATVRSFDLRGIPPSRLGRSLTAAAYLLLIELEQCDLIFGANYFLPRLMSAVARRRVITIHDLTYRRYPELLQKETLDNLEKEMAREIARSDAVICVSEATRQDVLADYVIDPMKVVTIHSGAEAKTSAPSAKLPLPPRYILFVSTIEPRKNLGTLIDAFEELKRTARYDGDLVVVGKIGWNSEETVRRFQTSRWSAAIHHLDYLSRDELQAVYEAAEVFVFPSYYEGFGLPLLEAMSYGLPVIAARTSSLPEIGGDAAIYFAPDDSAGLVSAIHSVTSNENLRASLSQRGRERASRFTWSRTADETLAVFRRVAEKS